MLHKPLHFIKYIFILFLWLNFSNSLAAVNIELKQAKFIVGQQNQPISQQALAQFKTVNLPHIWYRDESNINIAKETEGWYQTEFNLTARPNTILAVYIRKFNVNAQFYLNGQTIFDAGITQKPMPHYWNTPLYFSLPNNLLKIGKNKLTIHLITVNDFAMLSEIKIQPNAILRPQYEQRHFIQNKLSLLIFIFYLVMGSFIFSLWYKRKKDRIYLYLSMAIFTWATSTLAYFVLTPLISEHFFAWLVYSSIVWATTLMVIVILNYVGSKAIKLQRFLLFYATVGTVVYAIVPFIQLPSVHAVYILGSLLLAWYAVLKLIIFSFHKKTITPVLTTLSYILVQISGLHDWASTTGRMDSSFVYQLQLTGYTSVIFLIVISIDISRRYINALKTQETLNKQLKARIATKTDTLKKQHSALQQLQQNQAINEERKRIYLDLSEDVGAKILQLIYRGKSPENQELAKAALQDLRDVVAQTNELPTSFEQLTAAWHIEAENRLENANIELVWQQTIQNNTPINSSYWGLNLGRVIREAISNSIKHSQTDKLIIKINANKEQTTVIIEEAKGNNAKGKHLKGNGINNMKTRITKLNGSIVWALNPNNGYKITIQLPSNFRGSNAPYYPKKYV